VGATLGDGPRPVIEAALARARIECRLGADVVRIDSDGVVLTSGETVAADAVVLTTGMVASGFVAAVPGKRDPLGRVVVDRALRALGAPNIFIAGDAAAADGGDGHRVVQSCQHALQSGRTAGENAARDLAARSTLPYLQPPYITCLDLGRSGAVFTTGWDRVVRMTGSSAKAIKRRINTEVIYPPAEASRDELLAMSSIDPALQRRRSRHGAVGRASLG
jgi:NADH:ubiquinone reductase (H+-translocating)